DQAHPVANGRCAASLPCPITVTPGLRTPLRSICNDAPPSHPRSKVVCAVLTAAVPIRVRRPALFLRRLSPWEVAVSSLCHRLRFSTAKLEPVPLVCVGCQIFPGKRSTTMRAIPAVVGAAFVLALLQTSNPASAFGWNDYPVPLLAKPAVVRGGATGATPKIW